MEHRDKQIIEIIKSKGECSSKEVFDAEELSISYSTLKRILTQLIKESYIESVGQGTKYKVSSAYALIQPIDMDSYYEKEIDERKINESFNFDIIKNVFANNSVFTDGESETLKKYLLTNLNFQ